MSTRCAVILAAIALALASCSASETATSPPPAPDVPSRDAALDVALDTPDTPDVSDVSRRCSADGDCAADPGGPVCDVASGRCVACTAANDRCAPAEHCDPAINRCVPGCRADEGCAKSSADGGLARRVCDLAVHACVECVRDEHCAPGTLCVGNTCVVGCNPARPCPSGQACCAGACVDPLANTSHCGRCDNRCAVPNTVPACRNGACAVATCSDGFGDCDATAANGCETDTRTSAPHCGACGRACAERPNSAASCAGGTCAYACAAGFADCDGDAANGCETDTRTSASHCGACGRRCDPPNATAVCGMGSCAVAACADGFGDCDGNATNGCETDVRASVTHCGRCGASCPAPPNGVAACSRGTCAFTCVAGFADCDGDAVNGCETDTRTSASHCGGCGRACVTPGGTPSCAASVCAVSACTAGRADCDGSSTNGCETDTATARAHCGGCGRACAAGAACSAGTCVGADGPLTVATGARRVIDDLRAAGTVSALAGANVSTPQAGAFREGQEVLLINLQGTATDVGSVGHHEFLEVASVRDGVVVLTRPPTLVYGNSGANADLAGQRVFLVRVPYFTNVTVDGTLSANPWAAVPSGLGLVVFRASGAVTVGASGAIEASALGYRSNASSCNGVSGLPGESLAPQPATAPGDCYYETPAPSREPNRGGGGGGLSNCNRYACATQALGAGGAGASYGSLGVDGANNGAQHRGGAAGALYGAASLGDWFLGSGGGAGAGGTSGPGTITSGGTGGGLVFVEAPTITVRGRIASDGRAGGDNANCSLTSGSGSGGGGSGGTIYLSATTLVLSGSTVRAAGAAGGCQGGGAGGAGRLRVDCSTLDGTPCAGLSSATTTPPAFVGAR